MDKVLYRDKWYTIKKRAIKVRGRHSYITVIDQKSVSVVAPILADGRVLLEKQYRHALGNYLYELPAGHIEGSETPLHAAARELEEESGYTPHSMKYMFKEYASPGTGNRMFYYFYCKIVEGKRRQRLDDTEEIELVPMSTKRISSMIKSNKIVDHKTIAGFLYYTNYVKKG